MKKLILYMAIIAAFAAVAYAATPLSQLRYTPDITINLSGTVVAPNAVADENPIGALSLAASGLSANVAAYHNAGAVQWFVFDTTVVLPGGITATPRDIISWNGASYSRIFQGSANGLPDAVAIDALSSTNGGDFLISFDTTVALPGGITAGPADVVRYNGGTWSLYFNSTAAGVPAGLNLDGLTYLSNGHLLISFDTAGAVGGVTFASSDILEYTPGTPGTWEMSYSAMGYNSAWTGANLKDFWAQAAPVGSAGTLQLSSPTYSVSESGGTATITVTRAAGTIGAVSVNYATADGTANQPGDYTSSSGTLSWADGDTSPKTFTVTIINDALVEGNETVLLSLSSPTGGAALGTQSTATLTIIDDDTPPNTPVVTISGGSIAFGNQVVGVTSGSQGITITNTGSADLTINSLTPGGADAGDFVLSGSCTSLPTLSAGASCDLNATFTPGATGPRIATVKIGSTAVNSPTTVNLSGTGVTTAAANSAVAVPTMGEYGMLLLSGLLGLLGIWRMRRRQCND
jgi:hypothetical protein